MSTLPATTGPAILVLKGEFELSDRPAELAQKVQWSGARIVTFESNGGNVSAAMAFGRVIRSLGLATIQVRSAQCASACALAFVGGATRAAEPGSIGVHRSSFSGNTEIDGPSAVAAVQAMTAEIMTYLIEMGVDPRLLQLSLSVDSSDMRYLTASEMSLFGVTSSDKNLEASPIPIPTVVPRSENKQTDITPSSTARDRVLAFVSLYHDAWSWPNPRAIAFMETAYAEDLQFYGKFVSRDVVLREKRVFAERWPQRAYNVRHGSEQVYCGATCTVNAIVDWYAFSPKRSKLSSGTAQFSLTWNPLTGKIESEAGRVLETDRNVRQPKRIIGQWYDQNGVCRGGSGDQPETLLACDLREALGAKLEAIGWCYGREGEYGYQMRWHICGQ